MEKLKFFLFFPYFQQVKNSKTALCTKPAPNFVQNNEVNIMTDKEKFCKEVTVICDTREQENRHILSYLDTHN